MSSRYSIILYINSRDITTKKQIQTCFAVKNDYIQETIKWFNINYQNRIKYDNNGYYISDKLTVSEKIFLEDTQSYQEKIDIVFMLILISLQNVIKVNTRVKLNDIYYNVSTIDNFLHSLKLPKLKKILGSNVNNKIYYLTILPHYYVSGDTPKLDKYYSYIKKVYRLTYDEIFCINNLIGNELKNLYSYFDDISITHHTNGCLELLFFISYLLEPCKHDVKFYTHSVFEYELKLPMYINKEVFNTIFVFESNVNHSNIEISNIESEYRMYSSIDYLDIDVGLMSPGLDNIPFYNPYITYKLSLIETKNKEKIDLKIKSIIISKYLLNTKTHTTIKREKFDYIGDYDPIFTSFFSKRKLYTIRSNFTSAKENSNNLVVHFKDEEDLINISNMLMPEDVLIISLSSFKVYIINSIPFIYYFNSLLTLKRNFPYIDIEFINDTSKLNNICNVFSIKLDTKYKLLCFSKDRVNFSIKLFEKKTTI